jgi:hypothetical protein
VRITGLGITQALARIDFAGPVRRPYTAPERSAGPSWDRRADIFSLGALTYELLWAKRIAGTGREAAAAITAPLSGADADTLRQLFARVLAEDPSERFGTAGEFAAALTEALTKRRPTTDSRLLTHALLPLDGGEVRDEADDTVATEPPPRAQSDDEDTIPDTTLEVEDPDATVPDTSLASDDTEDTIPDVGIPAEEAADLVTTPAADDLVLHTAEDERYADAETAPSVVDPPLESLVAPRPPEKSGSDPEFLPAPQSGSDPDFLLPTPLPIAPPPAAELPPQRAPSFLIHPAARMGSQDGEPQRAGLLPIALALMIGVALGFASGYWLGSFERDASPRASVAADTAVAEKPAAPAPDAVVSKPPATAEGTEVRLPPLPGASEDKPSPAPSAAKEAPAPGAKAAASSTGRLTIRSAPAGARVSVDGRDVGKTPVTIRDVARGAHIVRISRDDYRTEERRVTVTAARSSRTVTAQLLRVPAPRAPASATRYSASLTVDSRPTGAVVFIDGKRIGMTPMALDAFATGTHAVRLELDGYKPWTASVRVVAGEKNRVAASLER